jgi:general secretion pathway protein C
MHRKAGNLKKTLGGSPIALLASLLLISIAVQSARLIWALVVPIGPIGAWHRSPLPQSGGTNGFDPFFRLQTGPQQAVVTSLSLQLFGIRMDSAMGRGSAIIATPDGVQSSYAVGDEIVPGVTLKVVSFDSVTLDRGGASEQLFLDQSVPAPAAQIGTRPVVQAAGLVVTPPAPVTIQNHVGFAPRFEGEKVTGLLLNPKGDGAAFKAAGLAPGDVLLAINGQPVTSLDDVSSLPSGGGTAILKVERGGRVMTVNAKVGQ